MHDDATYRRLILLTLAGIGIGITMLYATGVRVQHNTPVAAHTAYAPRVDVEALWAEHDALVACIANTAYTRDLIPQCLSDYTDVARVTTCAEDEACWDCTTMGNKRCGVHP